jgi:multiple sugar transport system ATP-binding protein
VAAVTLRGLSRRYGESGPAALDALDLDVAEGELLVLVGPSGCGKSTALRLIAGLDAPSSGTIHIGARDVGRVPPQERDVAMVFQGYALYPHLTVRDNLAFPLRMRGVPASARAARIAEAAETLGLARLLDRLPAELSGGERQRAAMGRAIVRQPSVFLFDEPLSNLDAALRAELRVEITALMRRLGTTSLYVTHDQSEAMTMASRIAVLRGGVLQQVGSPRAIYESPANEFVAGFLGAPAMNFIALTRDGEALRGAGTAVPAPPGAALPASIKIGIRPEHLYLRPEAAGMRPVIIEAHVTAREALGAETHLHFDADGTKLRAKVPGWDGPSPGDRTQLYVDLDHLLWFDVASGARIEVARPPYPLIDTTGDSS